MSGGYTYGEREPTENCPYCQAICRAGFVDIGIGFQQCGPFHCEECGASEVGTYDELRTLTPEEEETGWYGPGAPPGSSANTMNGRVVSYVQVQTAYRQEFTANPLWHDKKYVADWWRRLRKGF